MSWMLPMSIGFLLAMVLVEPRVLPAILGWIAFGAAIHWLVMP